MMLFLARDRHLAMLPSPTSTRWQRTRERLATDGTRKRSKTMERYTGECRVIRDANLRPVGVAVKVAFSSPVITLGGIAVTESEIEIATDNPQVLANHIRMAQNPDAYVRAVLKNL